MGLDIVSQMGLSVLIKNYMKDSLESDEIVHIAKALDRHPKEFVREKELADLGLLGEDFSVEEWAEIIVENPQILQRPIEIIGDEGVIGRPPEVLKSFLINHV